MREIKNQKRVPVFKAIHTDFDLYHESAISWDLDFILLSKNDFSSYINMYFNDDVQIGRTKLNGKIKQSGLTPKGYRTIGITANFNAQFNWMNRKITGNQFIVFPKDRTIDTISYNDFDVFVISINETRLIEMIENLGYYHAKKIFNSGDEKYFNIDKSFSHKFCQLLERFLQQAMVNQLNKVHPKFLQAYVTNHILIPLLKHIENSNQIFNSSPQRKRDRAIKKAVEIINHQAKKSLNISKLCQLTNVSERTLEYAFLEKFQISPSEYIKATKLHMVKNELATAKEQKLKISYIANKYGFWHKGQFAADFKNHFGILPSDIYI